MARVVAVREIALRGGASEEDFQRYLVEEYYPAFDQPAARGVRVSVLKGDRGDRQGRYLHLLEFESVELRNRLIPSGQPSDELRQWRKANATVLARWDTFATPITGGGSVFTDYVEVGR